MSKKSCLAATILQGEVLLITVWGGARMVTAWRGASWLHRLPLSVPWWYLPLSGAAWALAGLAVWLMFFTDHAWTPYALLTVVVTFAAFWWLDRYLLPQAHYFAENRLLALVITAVAVVMTVLLTLPPVWNSLFGADDERTPQSQN